MSFGFTGFGQNNANNANNNQPQQNTGFGGFGSGNAGNTGGFGSSNSTAFGSNSNTGGAIFGNTSSGFGPGGFGSNPSGNTQSAFGSTPASTGGGLFGSGTSTSGNTGFGFGSSNTQNASPFGSNTSGGVFGNTNKPAFGSNANTSAGSSLFGGGASNTGFGGGNTSVTGAFGAPASTALGANNTPPCEGTGGTPFQPFIEKDGGSNQNNHYQTITFLQSYQKWSLDELRLADYAQGRRFGNASNQVGAFGASTGFGGSFGNNNATNTGGGFGSGNTGSGIFGNSGNTNANPFGNNQSTAPPFGGNTGPSGIFGNKPGGSGLFGAANNTPATSAQGGGLFGGSNTSTAFGGSSGGGGGGGGLFGSNINNNAAKPGGFTFGGGNTGTSAFGGSGTSGFGATNTSSSGGLFGGSTATTSPFGGAGQQQANANPFAQNQNQNQNQNQAGGTSLFAGMNQNNQAKPAGSLFGGAGSNTGGGLFGNANNQQPQQSNLFNTGASNTSGTNPFGATGTANNNSGSSLFGGQSNNTGGNSLFGSLGNNTQNQPNQGGGLFGSNNQQQSKPGGLFGASLNAGANNTNTLGNNNNATGGNSLFGGLGSNNAANNNNASNQQGNSLFGAINQNQQQPGAQSFAGSSLFGGSQQSQPANQQPQGLSTSIHDVDPYGSLQLFSGLGTPNAQNTGPIATPLSSSQKLKKNALLPQYKINPSASARYTTPQKRGYGFSYSTYGSPSSVSSSATSTPLGLSSSFLGGSLGRSLAKSQSTSSLRRNFDSDESVLSPGAFSSAGSRRYGNSSRKTLTINRNIHPDLFVPSPLRQTTGALQVQDKPDQTPQRGNELKKRVSFESGAIIGNGNGSSKSNIFNQTNGTHATPSAEEMGYMRSSTHESNNSTSNGITNNDGSPPEMAQVRGNELAIVPEDSTPPPTGKDNAASTPRSQEDQQIGSYWMKPSKEELTKMPREKLKKVSGFTVGREGCGQITFDAPVDLTNVDLDNLYDNEVIIATRNATVYQNDSTKPPPGKGLNVPSTITLENSWPRSRKGRRMIYETSGKEYDKHLYRLERVPGTTFVSYDSKTGTWVFKVPHFTTYGLDYDDESDGEGNANNERVLGPPPDTTATSESAGYPMLDGIQSGDEAPNVSYVSEGASETYQSAPDDTFDFKRKNLPGAFDDQGIYEDDDEMTGALDNQDEQPFLDRRSVGLPSESGINEALEAHNGNVVNGEDGSVMNEDQEMAGSFPQSDLTTELSGASNSLYKNASVNGNGVPMPKSILKSRKQSDHLRQGTQTRRELRLGGDWVDQLQRTMSPRKQDREALRQSRANFLQETEEDGHAIPQGKTRTVSTGHGIHTSIDLMNSLFGQGQNLKWPYSKKPKSANLDESSMDPKDKAFHQSMKPTWGPSGNLLITARGMSGIWGTGRPEQSWKTLDQRNVVLGDTENIRLTKLRATNPVPKTIEYQRGFTEVLIVDEVPYAKVHPNFDFQDLSELLDNKDMSAYHEGLVWELAGVLFDDVKSHIPKSSEKIEPYLESRVRKERLSRCWAVLVERASLQQAGGASSKEEEAVAHLGGHRIEDACAALLDGLDFRLATLVSMIGGDTLMREDMQDQINEWRRLKVLSEMSEPIRALYELVAGEVCVCEGNKGALEDQARSFVISDRFRFTWMQSFGLRLWYGTLEEEGIEVAVQQYSQDLEEKREERVRPVPWFDDGDKPASWEDRGSGQGEDIVWGLLKLYSDKAQKLHQYPLEEVLRPQNLQKSRLDYRFSWQLYQTLRARKIADFTPEAGPDTGETTPAESIVRLTLDYAWQLESAGQWTWAVFVVLHLKDPQQRMAAILALLGRHGGSIGNGEQDDTFRLLVHEYLISKKWVWEAKALYMRSVEQNHVAEVDYLLKANNWDEAHRTLCRIVAPRAIIEGDLDTLKHLLSNFENVDLVPDWSMGGQVYADYLRLLSVKESDDVFAHPGSTQDKSKAQKGLPRDNKTHSVITRMVNALPAMIRDEGKLGVYEKVAVQEMSGAVGKIMLSRESSNAGEKSKILSLPLTEDRYLKHTVDLALGYYKAVMAGGGK